MCVYGKVNVIKHGSSVDIFVYLYINIIGVTEIAFMHISFYCILMD
jgi:hypothetical protein